MGRVAEGSKQKLRTEWKTVTVCVGVRSELGRPACGACDREEEAVLGLEHYKTSKHI